MKSQCIFLAVFLIGACVAEGPANCLSNYFCKNSNAKINGIKVTKGCCMITVNGQTLKVCTNDCDLCKSEGGKCAGSVARVDFRHLITVGVVSIVAIAWTARQ